MSEVTGVLADLTPVFTENRSPAIRCGRLQGDPRLTPFQRRRLAIGRAAAPPVAGREALADLLPFAPTTARNFARGDKLGALLTVHQPTRRPAQTVLLETEIIDAAGAVVRTATRTIAAEAFSSGGVEHRFELPLAALSPGDYLLRFVATAGDARAQRDVRFTVEP